MCDEVYGDSEVMQMCGEVSGDGQPPSLNFNVFSMYPQMAESKDKPFCLFRKCH